MRQLRRSSPWRSFWACGRPSGPELNVRASKCRIRGGAPAILQERDPNVRFRSRDEGDPRGFDPSCSSERDVDRRSSDGKIIPDRRRERRCTVLQIDPRIVHARGTDRDADSETDIRVVRQVELQDVSIAIPEELLAVRLIRESEIRGTVRVKRPK